MRLCHIGGTVWFSLVGPESDKDQLVDDASNSRGDPQHEVSPLQVEPSPAERYYNFPVINPGGQSVLPVRLRPQHGPISHSQEFPANTGY